MQVRPKPQGQPLQSPSFGISAGHKGTATAAHRQIDHFSSGRDPVEWQLQLQCEHNVDCMALWPAVRRVQAQQTECSQEPGSSTPQVLEAVLQVRPEAQGQPLQSPSFSMGAGQSGTAPEAHLKFWKIHLHQPAASPLVGSCDGTEGMHEMPCNGDHVYVVQHAGATVWLQPGSWRQLTASLKSGAAGEA